MKIASVLLVFVTSASAQTLSLFFSTEGTETTFNGVGGSLTSPGNYAAVFRDEAIVMVTPAMTQPSAAACADRALWAAHFGDDDGDGDFVEGVIGHTDGLHLRPSATNPPSVFDFWISVSDDLIGPMGALNPITLRDGDIFRVRPGVVPLVFITEAQIGQAMGNVMDFNVDGFAINDTNGDLYFTMSTTQDVNGISVEDGGLVRILGTSLTLNSAGTVTSVVPGSAQIVLYEVHSDIFFFSAGLGLSDDLKDIAFAPGGGTFTGPGGLQVPNLWLTGDAAGAAVVSTIGGGSIAIANGVSLSGGPAFGLGATDFQGGPNSNLTCLAIGNFALTNRPRFLSLPSVGFTSPGTLTVSLGGFTPGLNAFLFANLGVTSPLGSFTPKMPIAAGSSLGAPGSHLELFVDDFTDPLFTFTALLPPLNVSSLGYASVSYPLPALVPGAGITLQAIDASNFALSTPAVVITL